MVIARKYENITRVFDTFERERDREGELACKFEHSTLKRNDSFIPGLSSSNEFDERSNSKWKSR